MDQSEDNSERQVDFSSICRLCISENILLINLHPSPNVKVKPSSSNILDIIERFTTIKINPTDGFPQRICQNCIQTLNTMLAFQNKCKRSDTELRKMKLNMDMNDDHPNIKVEVDDELNIPDMEPDISKIDLESVDENNHVLPGPEIRYDFDSFNITDESYKAKRYRPPRVACHICGKLYETYKLQFHINRHNGLKPYQCGIANCNSKFAAPHELNKHKKICHLDKPNLFCDVCGKGFKLKCNLDMHRSYHFDPKIPCSVCDKLFRNTRALKKHMLVHSQERKFKCEYCDKSFQTRYTLRIHVRVHTQDKPYSCVCGVSFAYKCLLKSHTEKYHKQTNCLPPYNVSPT